MTVPVTARPRLNTTLVAADVRQRLLRRRHDTELMRWLCLAYFAFWLIEGAIRKWVLPGAQQPLYFIRVPVVLAIILLGFRQREPSVALLGATFTVAGFVTFDAYHVMCGDESYTQMALGVRLLAEFVLVPIAAATTLRRSDAMFLVRVIALSGVLVAPLAVIQVVSPVDATVNKIFKADSSDVFVTFDGVARASGLFTSSLGHAMYVILVVFAVLSLALDGVTRLDRIATYVAAPAAVVMVATSGSRSALYGAAGGAIAAFVIQVVRRPESSPRLLGIVALTYLGLRLSPFLAPGAVQGLLERTTQFSAEGQGRITHTFIGWTEFVDDSSTRGKGLGTLAQGLVQLNGGASIESELDRWVIELGLPLFAVAAFGRLLALSALLLQSIRQVVVDNRATAAIMMAGSIPALLTGQVTAQGSVNGFAVVVLIIVLGALRSSDDPHELVP